MTELSKLRPTEGTPLTAEVQQLLTSAIKGIRFGQVVLVVQDGRVVQIDRLEKTRLSPPGP
jgi:hypothetical protein